MNIAVTPYNASSEMVFPPSFTGMTAFGWIALWISFRVIFINRRNLMTLIPPAVEPTQPPIIIRIIKTNWEGPGHREKSAIVNPDAELMETTWNMANRMDSAEVYIPDLTRLIATNIVAQNITRR